MTPMVMPVAVGAHAIFEQNIQSADRFPNRLAQQWRMVPVIHKKG